MSSTKNPLNQRMPNHKKGQLGVAGYSVTFFVKQIKRLKKKFLSDFSYTLFEKKLLDDNKVIEVDESFFIEELRDKAESISFIKVTAKAVFNDIRLIKGTLKNFNSIGLALAHVTNVTEINEVNAQLEKAKLHAKDRNQQSKLASQDKVVTKAIEKLAKDQGLQLNQTYLDNLALLLDYGFQDQLDIQMQLIDSMVSANLKRDCLRESEELIIKKYSRQTECRFVMFGIVTQYKRDKLDDIKEPSSTPSIKGALMNMVTQLTNLEETFIGRLSDEVIIDPIALCTEL